MIGRLQTNPGQQICRRELLAFWLADHSSIVNTSPYDAAPSMLMAFETHHRFLMDRCPPISWEIEK
jgi:hypothetical protein